jgi:CHAT domain-containing protein
MDDLVLRDDALVVLGTCDSGTIGQSDVNEALGIPVALRRAGAASVIGATWPVQRLAATLACAKLAEEIRGGCNSIEALRRTVVWLRDATMGQAGTLLEKVGHPLALKYKYEPGEMELRALEDGVCQWGAFMSWGTCWQARSKENAT